MMMASSISLKPKTCRRTRGSILIYVLWILVVISVLAFQLSSASRATVLSQSASTNQMKRQLQLDSAVQFAIFKIAGGQWQDRDFELNLNGQRIDVSIFNEAGFVSIYNRESITLQRIFDYLDLDADTVAAIALAVQQEKDPVRLNSFDELRRIDGIDMATVRQLIPLVSIFHEDATNPNYAPADVLMRIERVDQYRVQKLRESSDGTEKAQLRREVVESLMELDEQLAESPSQYYRVHVSIDGALHRVFLKYNRQLKRYLVVLVDDSQTSTGGKVS
jgi:type II secretory pathway component PulK